MKTIPYFKYRDGLMLHELDLAARLRAYKSAKEYVESEFPDLCTTHWDTMVQAYDEARQYGFEHGYTKKGEEWSA